MTYQQYKLTVYDLPFWVEGSETTITSPDRSANGTWTCQLRAGSGADRRVLRAFQFDVAGNVLQSHRAGTQVSMAPGNALIAVAFDAQALPTMFDPALVRSGFLGMTWSDPTAAPLFGDLPQAAQAPTLSTPPGVRVRRPAPTRRRARR